MHGGHGLGGAAGKHNHSRGGQHSHHHGHNHGRHHGHYHSRRRGRYQHWGGPPRHYRAGCLGCVSVILGFIAMLTFILLLLL